MERETILKAAVAKCFAARPREPVNVDNVRKHIEPDYPDFFHDFDANKPLDDVEIFREIQATYAASKPAAVEEFPAHLPPSDRAAPPLDTTLEIAPPVATDKTERMANGPGLSPQATLDAMRTVESDLIGRVASLNLKQRAARTAVELARIALAALDPNKQTPEMVAADFRRTSQETRAARAQPAGPVAFVDAERKYQRGGDANSFARRMSGGEGHLNRRGAYAQAGGTNTDPARGGVPKPVAPRPTIPALGK